MKDENNQPKKTFPWLLIAGLGVVLIGLVVIGIVATKSFEKRAGEEILEIQPKINDTSTQTQTQTQTRPGCGDGVVQADETVQNCRVDVLSKCGDGVCDEWEHYRYCGEDCPSCIVDDFDQYSGPNECPPSPHWKEG